MLGASANNFIVLDHRRTQIIMSFVSGIMLGIAVFHLLPHALYAADNSGDISFDVVAYWIMAGLLCMFLLQRVFHFHQHDFDEEFSGEACEHTHGEIRSVPSRQELSKHGGSWGVFLGLAVHSLIDGIALAASMQASFSAASVDTGIGIAGLGVFLAILLHKPLDALTIGIFLNRTSVSKLVRWFILLIYAMLCPAMAALLLAGYSVFNDAGPIFIVAALAFSAGIFLCIALSDLLPEIHFHKHDRFKMTVVLLAGIFLSLAIKGVESNHSHKLKIHSASKSDSSVSGEHSYHY